MKPTMGPPTKPLTKHEALQAAYTIPGWMWPAELGWLYDTCAASAAHLEVGCFCGKSLYVAALAMASAGPRPRLCVAVDPLRNATGDLPAGSDWEPRVLTATLEAVAERTGARPQWWTVSSVEAMRLAHERRFSFDSIFIDADHHYAEVKADIEGWRQFLRPGGILCGHDYWPAHPGVMDAVNEVFGSDFQVAPTTRIWWHRSPS